MARYPTVVSVFSDKTVGDLRQHPAQGAYGCGLSIFHTISHSTKTLQKAVFMDGGTRNLGLEAVTTSGASSADSRSDSLQANASGNAGTREGYETTVMGSFKRGAVQRVRNTDWEQAA